MNQHLKLTLNIVGIALILTTAKALLDVFFVVNNMVQYRNFVLSPFSGYFSIAIASCLVAFWTGHRNALLASYLFYWLSLLLLNSDIAFRAYQHSPLTLWVLLLLAPLPGVLFAIGGGLLGRILRFLTGIGRSQENEEDTNDVEES